MPAARPGEGHLVGEDGALVEDAVAVGVLEPDDPVRRVLEQLGRGRFSAGGIGDVQPAAIIEARHDRPFDQRRSRDPLDDEAVGDVDRGELLLGREASRRRRFIGPGDPGKK